jgi:hypothetical protein
MEKIYCEVRNNNIKTGKKILLSQSYPGKKKPEEVTSSG